VLDDVSFDLCTGEVHLLAGENGAGKSTLIKILAGMHVDYDGAIELEGRRVRFATPHEANRHGISVIHQEMSLIDSMSVADNIFLGREPAGAAGWLDRRAQREQALRICRQLDLDFTAQDLARPVEEFALSVKNRIEIAKALSFEAKVLVMDEPTSALNAPEVEKLFALIRSLKQRGCGIVYISHKMEEIERIADRITVLRDGQWVGTAPAKELPTQKFIQWMVGRDLGEQFPRRAPHPGTERLRLDCLSVYPDGFAGKPAVENVSLEVRAGEILGIGGLQGSGASQLLLAIFGAYGNATRGRLLLDEREVQFVSPRAAIESGLVLLTNDRKATGLVLSLSIIANATLAGLRELTRAGWRRTDAERAAAESTTSRMKLRAASLELEVGALSGGNQQKVAIAKWLQTRPKVLLLDEPTRGIDVAAKREIYQLMDEWTAQGMAIVLISSEMPELLTLSDRIVVMHRGQLTATFTRAQVTPEAILAAAMGQSDVPAQTETA